MNSFIVNAVREVMGNYQGQIPETSGEYSVLISDLWMLSELVEKSVIRDVKADGNAVIVELLAPSDTPVGRADHPEGGHTDTYVFSVRLVHGKLNQLTLTGVTVG